MKRTRFAVVLSLVVLGVWFAWGGQPGGQAQQPASQFRCADVNGSGVIDISDPVYLLNWLFLGGAKPQCPTGCPAKGRFLDNGDGTVTDICTGLMWQKDTADVNGDGQSTADQDFVSWEGGVAYCDNLILANDGAWLSDPTLAGEHGGTKYDDWRLPNIQELVSIIDYGRFGPAIDPVFRVFIGTPGNPALSVFYWSSTILAGNSPWFVNFHSGAVNSDARVVTGFVLAVRTMIPDPAK